MSADIPEKELSDFGEEQQSSSKDAANTPGTEQKHLPPRDLRATHVLIRDTVMSHQSEVAAKFGSMFRIIGSIVVLLIAILLGNFGLTVAAVVSNKDVYVNDKGLVDSKGERLEVKVGDFRSSVYDLPHQGLHEIASLKYIIVPDGDSTLILFPTKFEFSRVQAGYYQLSMTAAADVSVTWGPPSTFEGDGRLARHGMPKFISVTRANGEKSTTFSNQKSRRLGKDDKGGGNADAVTSFATPGGSDDVTPTTQPSKWAWCGTYRICDDDFAEIEYKCVHFYGHQPLPFADGQQWHEDDNNYCEGWQNSHYVSGGGD